MQKKLTISIDADVYDGLRERIGPRRISRFLNDLARPHVTPGDSKKAMPTWRRRKRARPRLTNGARA